MEFARITFPSWTGFEGATFMFVSAFFLLGLVPLLIIRFFLHRPTREFGLMLGDWKLGLKAVAFLLPLISLLILYPASRIEELRNFYPFDKEAAVSLAAFLRLQVSRAAFYYTAWEFFFRGFMLFGLRKHMGDGMAVLIQTVPSCLWHIGLPAGELFSSVPAGILFGLLALRTRSILWPLLLHMLIGVVLDALIVLT